MHSWQVATPGCKASSFAHSTLLPRTTELVLLFSATVRFLTEWKHLSNSCLWKLHIFHWKHLSVQVSTVIWRNALCSSPPIFGNCCAAKALQLLVFAAYQELLDIPGAAVPKRKGMPFCLLLRSSPVGRNLVSAPATLNKTEEKKLCPSDAGEAFSKIMPLQFENGYRLSPVLNHFLFRLFWSHRGPEEAGVASGDVCRW